MEENISLEMEVVKITAQIKISSNLEKECKFVDCDLSDFFLKMNDESREKFIKLCNMSMQND